MTIEKFLDTVTGQIRWKQARGPVSEELRAHILDQAAAYEKEMQKADGKEADREEAAQITVSRAALERAVAQMGDPLEIGTALDKIHRPQVSWSLLLIVGALGVMNILLHAILRNYSVEGYSLGSQIGYVAAGYLLMLVVYHLDYSFFGRYCKRVAVGFLLFLIAGTFFSQIQVGGASGYFFLTRKLLINVKVVIQLYLPIYGMLLYSYKGQGYFALLKLLLWAAVPVIFLWRLPCLSMAIVMGMSMLLLLTIAVAKGWFQVNRRAVLTGLWSVTLGLPCLVAVMVMTGFSYRLGLADYQAARLASFLSGTKDAYGADYQAVQMQSVLENCLLGGGSAENLQRAASLPGYNSDYVFVSLMAAYGMMAGVLVMALLAGAVIKIFRVSFRQKDGLGMMVGCSCGMALLMQTMFCILVNFDLVPVGASYLPFLCYGGSTTITCYLLMGIALSVYRYQNMPARKISMPKWRLELHRE